MLRDQGFETMDSKVLDDLTVADFNMDTVRAYRMAWTGLHQTPEVIPSGEVKTVRVDNFAYASPELVKPENLKVEAPLARRR